MTAATALSVQYLNLAYFGRPADPASLVAFPQSGLTDEEIVLSFVKTSEYTTNTVSPNSTANPSGGVTFNETSLINTFYQRLFGRLASATEVAGWSTAIATGTVNYDYLGITILNAGLNLPAGTAMRDVLIAKFDSAQLYSGNLYNNAANAQAYTTAAAAQKGVDFLTGITTSTAATVAEANAAVTSMVTGSTSTGKSFVMTTGIDNIVGTAGSDTINAANGTTDTITTPDVIDGGAGIDTLALVIDTGGVIGSPTVTNVENLSIRNTIALNAGGSNSIDLDGFTSVTDFTANTNTAAVGVTNFDKRMTAFEMLGSKADVALESGDVVTLNLELNNVHKDDTVDFRITEGATAITTLNVKSVGTAANTLAVLEADEATTMSFDAAGGAITITDIHEAAAVTKLNTSGASDVTFADLTDAAVLVTVVTVELVQLAMTSALPWQPPLHL